MKRVTVMSSTLIAVALVTGCAQKGNLQNSSQQPSSNAAVSKSVSKPASTSVNTVANTSVSPQSAGSSSTHKNGTLISMQKVSVKGQNPKIQLYKMFYWSEGAKVEAFMSEPKNAGSYQYPLLVSCHGGYVTPENSQHANSPISIQYLKNDSSRDVLIAPQYRGYAESGGTVHGLLGDTLDAENAITAADSLKQVNSHFMQVNGASMGGGVALMIASNPKYVGSLTSVIAISPFVGWDVVGKYAMQHPKDQRDNQLLAFADKAYGKFSAAASAYTKRSPDITKMDAPVLLLQGTADKLVTWQSVQQFYKDMKAHGQTAKLVLIKGGHHGLKQHQKQVRQAINHWLAKH